MQQTDGGRPVSGEILAGVTRRLRAWGAERRRLLDRVERLVTGAQDKRTALCAFTADDRLRVVTTVRDGRVARLVVQLECRIGGRWLRLRRYDSAHFEIDGPFHLRLAPWLKKRGRRQSVPITGSLDGAVGPLVEDLMATWWDLRTAHVERTSR